MAVSPKFLKCCRQNVSRQHTTYTISPRKTRTDTHHSRALDSPLVLAKLHTAIFDGNPLGIGRMPAVVAVVVVVVVVVFTLKVVPTSAQYAVLGI